MSRAKTILRKVNIHYGLQSCCLYHRRFCLVLGFGYAVAVGCLFWLFYVRPSGFCSLLRSDSMPLRASAMTQYKASATTSIQDIVKSFSSHMGIETMSSQTWAVNLLYLLLSLLLLLLLSLLFTVKLSLLLVFFLVTATTYCCCSCYYFVHAVIVIVFCACRFCCCCCKVSPKPDPQNTSAQECQCMALEEIPPTLPAPKNKDLAGEKGSYFRAREKNYFGARKKNVFARQKILRTFLNNRSTKGQLNLRPAKH